jgi:hypothetical protein
MKGVFCLLEDYRSRLGDVVVPNLGIDSIFGGVLGKFSNPKD